MTREEAIEKLELMRQKVDEETYRALILAIKALENHDTFMKYSYSLGKHDALSQEPCDDTVSRGVFEQVMWERNIAIEQLHELGYELGQKIEPCDDVVSRNQSNACSILDDECPYPHKHCWECPLNYQYELAKHELDKNVDLPSVTQKSETVTEFADRCRECGKMRKGHWIYDETLENWRCSKCNETPKTMGYVGTADFMAEHFKFCNHCGAKMESEDKE